MPAAWTDKRHADSWYARGMQKPTYVLRVSTGGCVPARGVDGVVRKKAGAELSSLSWRSDQHPGLVPEEVRGPRRPETQLMPQSHS